MFTGIVEAIGTIQTISRGNKSLTLSISTPFATELSLGESVAVNGTCLTVTSFTKDTFNADVTPESFNKTSLGTLVPGSKVNLERAMKADGRFGGHIVSGHIDGTGRFIYAQKDENAINMSFLVSHDLGIYMIKKGSVTIDGISLTIADIKADGSSYVFTVAVIPHTWQNTILCTKKAGNIVNIECDIVGKYIEHFININKPHSKNEYDYSFISYHNK